MPYKSAAQQRLMQAVEHNPGFAKKVGIPQSVGRKFRDHKAKGGLAHLAEGGLPMGMMPTMAAGVPKGALGLFSNLMEYVRNLNVSKALPAEGWEQLLKAPEYKLEGMKFPLPPEEHQFFNTPDILAKLRAEGQPVDKAGMLSRLEQNQPKLSTQRLPDADDSRNSFKFPSYDGSSYRLPGPLGGPPDTMSMHPDYTESLTHYQPRLQDADPAADPDMPFAMAEDVISSLGLPPEQAAAGRRVIETGNRWAGQEMGQQVPVEFIDAFQMRQKHLNPEFKPAAGHFGEQAQNLLSHSRATRRQTVDGQPVRVVEEIQSDWHQQARDNGGYRDNQVSGKTENELIDEYQAWAQEQGLPGVSADELLYHPNLTTQQKSKIADFMAAFENMGSPTLVDASKPPIAPFKKNYGAVELKKQLGQAIDNGDEYLAWTTGEQQRDRYASALKKQVDVIRWYKTPDGKYSIEPYKDKNKVGAQYDVSEKDLDSLLGKEMAGKIRTTPVGEDGYGRLAGDNLTVGGQGMRQFYDKDLLDQAKKVVRQYGGNPETDIHMVKVPGTNQMPQQFKNQLDNFHREMTSHSGSRSWHGTAERIMDDAMDRFDPEAQNALEGPVVDAITLMGDADEAGDLANFMRAFKEYQQRVNEFYAKNSIGSEVPAIKITPQLKANYEKLKAKTGSGFSRYAVAPLALSPLANEAINQQDPNQWQ